VLRKRESHGERTCCGWVFDHSRAPALQQMTAGDGKKFSGTVQPERCSGVNAARLNLETGDMTRGENKHEADSLSSIRNGGEGWGEEERSNPALCCLE